MLFLVVIVIVVFAVTLRLCYLCCGLALLYNIFVGENLQICQDEQELLVLVCFFDVNLGENINFITLDRILIFQIL